MLTVGERFPEFDPLAVVGRDDSHLDRSRSKEYEGQKFVFFSWLKDFTFVCPKELTAFRRAESK